MSDSDMAERHTAEQAQLAARHETTEDLTWGYLQVAARHETTEDLTCGYLQVGSVLIAAEGPVITWGTLRPATPGEALLASRYPAFWLDPASGETYVREYPKRMSHLPARVVPALRDRASISGTGTLSLAKPGETAELRYGSGAEWPTLAPRRQGE